MRIDRVRVLGLFDEFDHDLAFRDGERIMIIVGPNGFGKTTTLWLIDALFNKPVGSLAGMPFREIVISFDKGQRLVVERTPSVQERDSDQLPLQLTYCRNGETDTYLPRRNPINERTLGIPVSAIDDIIPELDRIGPRTWLNLETGARLNLAGVIAEFPDHFPNYLDNDLLPGPDWLKDIWKSMSVRLVGAGRLTRQTRGARPWRRRHATSTTRTVQLYSEKIADKIKELTAEYGTLSESFDRSFPARVIAGRGKPSGTIDSLREDFRLNNQKRLQLEEVGILAVDQSSLDIPDWNQVDAAQQDLLSVFAEDTKRKLAIFDDLYVRVSALKRIANSRFLKKRLGVTADGLTAVRADGNPLDLAMLSSGEQHELVMLYELLFRAKGNSLILIDEPEISLHVAWQEQWLQDLEETARLSDFRAIVATHSPEIIGNRWNLAVDLSDQPALADAAHIELAARGAGSAKAGPCSPDYHPPFEEFSQSQMALDTSSERSEPPVPTELGH